MLLGAACAARARRAERPGCAGRADVAVRAARQCSEIVATGQ
jgi:hypothetical protein